VTHLYDQGLKNENRVIRTYFAAWESISKKFLNISGSIVQVMKKSLNPLFKADEKNTVSLSGIKMRFPEKQPHYAEKPKAQERALEN
jgi:DNA repair photolyase